MCVCVCVCVCVWEFLTWYLRRSNVSIPAGSGRYTCLSSLETEEGEVATAIETSNQVLASANDQIENTCQMIAKANALLLKAESVHEAETGQAEVVDRQEH